MIYITDRSERGNGSGSVRTYNGVCLFCGKEHKWSIASGLHYVQGELTSYDNNNFKPCNCELGKLVGKVSPPKAMCMNCAYFVNSKCTNDNRLAEIKRLLDAHGVVVHDPSATKATQDGCRQHEFNPRCLISLFEGATNPGIWCDYGKIN